MTNQSFFLSKSIQKYAYLPILIYVELYAYVYTSHVDNLILNASQYFQPN